MGVKKGDRVMLILKRHYQFWFAIVGLHKLGAIAVPATNQLMKKDLVYRFNSAGISAVVCTGTGSVASEVEAALPESAPEASEGTKPEEGEASPVDATDPAGEPAEPAGPEPITDAEVKSALRAEIERLIADYSSPERGIEVRQLAGGYRMATKPEQHDVVRAFAKSLKPPIRLSLQALETLAVIAYKQPITAPEISEVRGVDAGGVLGTLLDRKLITTAGRKQVIGRPILYKTTKEFLLRFGLKDVNELPSMEEFEKLAAESLGSELFAPTQTTLEQAATQAAVPSTTDAELPPEEGEKSAPSTPEGEAVPTESVPETTPEAAAEEQPSAQSAEEVAKDETEESKAAAQPE
jgi:segregation and condensation protein B